LGKFRCRIILMHFLLLICGKFTRAQLAHQIFFILSDCIVKKKSWRKNWCIILLPGSMRSIFNLKHFWKWAIFVKKSKFAEFSRTTAQLEKMGNFQLLFACLISGYLAYKISYRKISEINVKSRENPNFASFISIALKNP
jgi:hypothetical protein